MDQDRRRELTAKVKLLGLPDSSKTMPLVSLEDFFVGNDDISSIGCNLLEPPGPQVFLDVLRTIRSQPDVQDVLAEIMEVREEDETMWPFSERIYILADADESEVAAWVAALEPDDVAEGYTVGAPASAPPLEPNKKVFSVWWD
jgi:hypothetical protein